MYKSCKCCCCCWCCCYCCKVVTCYRWRKKVSSYTKSRLQKIMILCISAQGQELRSECGSEWRKPRCPQKPGWSSCGKHGRKHLPSKRGRRATNVEAQPVRGIASCLFTWWWVSLTLFFYFRRFPSPPKTCFCPNMNKEQPARVFSLRDNKIIKMVHHQFYSFAPIFFLFPNIEINKKP
jgi:hypothetical protein